MDTKIFITAIISFASLFANAQNNFAIYHTTGTVNLLQGSQTIKAERGKSFGKGTSLQVKLNATCMLIDSLGKSLSVNKPGTYTFTNLVDMLKNAGKENVPGEFFAYMYQNFKKEKKPDAQRVTAMVQRGHPLMTMPMDSVIIVTDKIDFAWTRVSPKLTMQLIIKDDQSNVLFDTTIKKTTTYTTAISNPLFVPGRTYKWKIDEAGTSQPSELYFTFIVPEKKDVEQIKKQQKAIGASKLPAADKYKMQRDLLEYWNDQYLHNTD